jgi:septal ring factor EnvC (AmiA/AmiB activator)
MGDQHAPQHRPQLMPHEQAALEALRTSPETVFHMVSDVHTLSSKLYRELVDWHTRFPDKPSLEASNEFWTQLKELRAAQFELEAIQREIAAQQKRTQTLTTQVEKAQETIHHIQHAFDSYLNRLNER